MYSKENRWRLWYLWGMLNSIIKLLFLSVQLLSNLIVAEDIGLVHKVNKMISLYKWAIAQGSVVCNMKSVLIK